MKNNILVFDTETTLGLYTPLIYDFGYKIITPKGEVLKEVSTLIGEVFDTRILMNSAYYVDKTKEYQRMYENGEISKTSFVKAFDTFVKDIRKYKVEMICAYNIAFDIRALNNTLKILDNRTFESKRLEKLINQKNKKLLCIWNLACETLLDTDEYREFAETHELKTEKGNFKTSAETAYAYLKNLPQFVEKHMALSDVEIEIEILLHILQNYNGNVTYGLHYGSWRKVQVKT
jgi:hypothetical protein